MIFYVVAVMIWVIALAVTMASEEISKLSFAIVAILLIMYIMLNGMQYIEINNLQAEIETLKIEQQQ